MHYADTTANDNDTVTAFCYCGWSETCDTQELADATAERHQNTPDDVDTDADESATA